MSTLILNGSGKGIVLNTGKNTVIGNVSALTNQTSEKTTDLQKEIRRFVIIVVSVAITMAIICVIVWASWLNVDYPGYMPLSVFLSQTISVTIAFIPEGLPVCLTLSLIVIARRMAKSRVLVKNTATIETLSCVNVIASDKTGTLTQNKMFVSSAAAGLNVYGIKPDDPLDPAAVDFNQLVAVAGLCNNAKFIDTEEVTARPKTAVVKQPKKGKNTKKETTEKKAKENSGTTEEQVADQDQATNSRPKTGSSGMSDLNAPQTPPTKPAAVPPSQRKANGDATDIALLKFSTEYNRFKDLNDKYTILAEIPFNSKNKWMVKIVRGQDPVVHSKLFGNQDKDATDLILLKGAPDILLKKSSHVIDQTGGLVLMSQEKRAEIVRIQNEWAMQGQRTILLCKRPCNYDKIKMLKENNQLEDYIHSSNDFCIVGILGIIDPPREGISDVIATCRGAGIRVFMVTGDYALTAAAIATQIGIFTHETYDNLEMMKFRAKENLGSMDSTRLSTTVINMSAETMNGPASSSTDQIIQMPDLVDGTKKKTKKEKYVKQESLKKLSLLLTGSDLEKLTEDEWRLVTSYEEIVLARTTPEQKLRTVKELQRDGYIVAVTGDGVNDAPALKSADIGIAMGSGSEVAMEASQLVLMDNNFESILVAIRNGRLVFDNVKKVILYLLPGGCFSELIPVLLSIFLGISQNISNFQMLVVSLFTDICPCLSLIMEKEESDLLKRPPRSKKDHLVDWKFLIQAYVFEGCFIAFCSQCCFFTYMWVWAGLSPGQIFLSFNNLETNYNSSQYSRFGALYADQSSLDTAFYNAFYGGQTVTFASIVIMQIYGNLMSTRTRFLSSLFQQVQWKKSTRNLYIHGAQFVSTFIMVICVFVPLFNQIFQTYPMPVYFLGMPLGCAFLLICLEEIRKLLVRNKILWFHKFGW